MLLQYLLRYPEGLLYRETLPFCWWSEVLSVLPSFISPSVPLHWYLPVWILHPLPSDIHIGAISSLKVYSSSPTTRRLITCGWSFTEVHSSTTFPSLSSTVRTLPLQLSSCSNIRFCNFYRSRLIFLYRFQFHSCNILSLIGSIKSQNFIRWKQILPGLSVLLHNTGQGADLR